MGKAAARHKQTCLAGEQQEGRTGWSRGLRKGGGLCAGPGMPEVTLQEDEKCKRLEVANGNKTEAEGEVGDEAGCGVSWLGLKAERALVLVLRALGTHSCAPQAPRAGTGQLSTCLGAGL